MRWMPIVLLILVLIGCGGSGGGVTATPTAAATATPAPVVAAPTAVTPTVAATVTLEPTAAAPTATVVVASADVQLGKWQLRKGPNEAQVFIEGEALNVGEADAQEIMVDIQLFDASDTLLGSERAYIITEIIPAGGMSPFFAFVFEVELEDVDDTQIDIAFKTFDEDSYHGFTYSLDIEIVELNWIERDISGELRNLDEFPLKLVSLAIIGYDENDDIVAVERATMDVEQVEPGETASFSSSFLAQQSVPARVVAIAQGVRVR